MPTLSPAKGRVSRLKRGVQIFSSVTVNRSQADCFNYVRSLENALLYVKRLISITPSDNRALCVAHAPNGKTVEWNLEITNEQPDRLIEWRTEEGAPVTHAGSVRFDPGPQGKGTVIQVAFEYDRPMTRALMAKVSGEDPTGFEIVETLMRLKSLLETGEIPTTEGQPRGPEI